MQKQEDVDNQLMKSTRPSNLVDPKTDKKIQKAINQND